MMLGYAMSWDQAARSQPPAPHQSYCASARGGWCGALLYPSIQTDLHSGVLKELGIGKEFKCNRDIVSRNHGCAVEQWSPHIDYTNSTRRPHASRSPDTHLLTSDAAQALHPALLSKQRLSARPCSFHGNFCICRPQLDLRFIAAKLHDFVRQRHQRRSRRFCNQACEDPGKEDGEALLRRELGELCRCREGWRCGGRDGRATESCPSYHRRGREG